MISRLEFEMQMDRLADAFGEYRGDKFSKRVDVYYGVLGGKLTLSQLIAGTSKYIETSKKFPTIACLIEVCRSFKETITENNSFCKTCDSSGTITAYKKLDMYPGKLRFAFNCPFCKNSKIKLPVYNTYWEKQGYTLDPTNLPKQVLPTINKDQKEEKEKLWSADEYYKVISIF